MANKNFIDVWRAVQEQDYVSKLSVSQMREMVASADWAELTAEWPELAEAMIDANQAQFARLGIGVAREAVANKSLQQAPEDFTVLGKSQPLIQWLPIFNGTANYTQNLTMPNMVYMKTLRSPHPHARVLSIDTSAAEALPGVVAVLHRFNIPEEYADVTVSGGALPHGLFDEEIQQVGAPIVALVAETEQIADEALKLIEVEYEVLPFVVDYLAGAQPDAIKLWDNDLDGTITSIREQIRGDPEVGFAEAALIVENKTSRLTEQNAPLELSSGLFWWENEQLNLSWTTRHAHADRNRLAQALGLPANQIRIVQVGYLGSSYGSHRTSHTGEIHAAILAKLTGRPVKYIWTRSEDFIYRTARAAETTEGKMGVTEDGIITAAEYKTIADSGALGSNRATGAWVGFQTLYNIPNLRLEGTGVYTNSVRSGTFRCVSHPYATLAQEPLIDRAAYALGMNPLDIRLANINEVGHPDTGRPYSNPGLRDTIVQATDTIGWADKWHLPGANEVRPGVFHGIGMAAHTCSHGAGGHPSTATVIVHTDGTLTVQSAAAEVGPGQRTVMRMIASETLGIPYDLTQITASVDTAFTADTGNTAGSRQTNSGGWGVYEAAMDAKQQILQGAAQQFMDDAADEDPPREIQVSPEELDIRDGFVFFKEDPDVRMEVGDAVTAVVPNSSVYGRGAHFHPPTWQRLAFGAHAAEVEVDTLTGEIKVLDYAAAHDIGRALNPTALENQIQGGVLMGLSAAIYEGLFHDLATGLPISDNILEYKMISIVDVPRDVKVIMVERPKEYGVYGAHGIGEPPMALPSPTIINAVYNAIGVWIEDTPLTRDKVLAAVSAPA